ncbi:MAG TPA: NADH-quinone oxidoreductase subunit C [Vicinamibacterales bacterium]|jgi:NADH-quinone oxidoreductase subunit C|nr:NADH-quinone oxidoreductase subunit C [Vicinamibacterales bacterium]
MQATDIIDALTRALPGDPARFQALDTGDGTPTILVAPEALVEACRVLRDDPALGFVFLADILPIDFHPREPRFEVNYLLASLGVGGYGSTPKRLRLKVRVAGLDPRVPSVADVWPAANWAEREAYDFFGLQIDGHPDLRRLLMPDDWEGFPMRKDYPVQIKEAVKVRWPLQVSEEEFIANIEAARERARED